MNRRISTHVIATLLTSIPIASLAEPAATSSDERYDEITQCLRALEFRTDLRRPFAPNEDKLAAITESLRRAEARAIEERRFLVLSFVVLEDDDLETIARLRSMEGIALDRCTLSAKGFETAVTAWSDSLERLSLNMITIDDDEGIAAAAMRRLGKLRYLRLSSCNVPGDVVTAASKLPIEVLDVNRIGKVDKTAFTALLRTDFKSLKALDVHHWKRPADREAVQSVRPEVTMGAIGKRYGVDKALP